MIATIVILGPSGDLTSRFLIPAIMRLYEAGELPAGFRIVGLARDDWDTAAFRRHLEGKITSSAQSHSPSLSTRDAILASTEYHPVDVTDRNQLAEALGKETQPVVVYLALPPSLFKPTIGTLATFRLPQG
ncbi:MAG: hypothetical protein ABI856_06190 [Nitrospira sp.]